ncbi:MAG: hypothetical protein H6708_23335 [Kofleriaceae bacterium]|nr:hypothetical protein [Kofleriaceae bacterium]
MLVFQGVPVICESGSSWQEDAPGGQTPLVSRGGAFADVRLDAALMRTLLPLLSFLGACGHTAHAVVPPAPRAAAPAAPDAPPARALATEPSLRWGMRVEGGTLRVDYTITNETAARVYLFDAVMTRGTIDDDGLLIGPVLDGDTVTLRRGIVFGDALPGVPSLRFLEPGASVARTAHLPLATLSALDQVTRAILAVQYVVDPGAHSIRAMKQGDGTTTYWVVGEYQWLEGEVLVVPVAAAGDE